ncbi:hypothetical protein [Paenibacillus oleatilyticus]|uniref:hypothetical protein n=1 Tax=Paenibacillus oleatilyticus TaxID=2594886 RepID=UPI001C1FFA53|nr:hypothetical protein [Paenibacillus oleatilyticus]MBU7316056.1 hypothetical protein [Paenibacillus oleatilyticus]
MNTIPKEVIKAIKDAHKHFKKANEANQIARDWLEAQGLLGEVKNTDFLEIEDQYIDVVEHSAGDLDDLLKLIKDAIK